MREYTVRGAWKYRARARDGRFSDSSRDSFRSVSRSLFRNLKNLPARWRKRPRK